jgi:hypothetical protein
LVKLPSVSVHVSPREGPNVNQRHIDELGGLHYEDPGPFARSRTAPPTTEADIREFEDKLGHRLPDDYAAFLLRFNEGPVRFGKPVRFRVTVDEAPEWVYLDTFYSLDALWTVYRLHGGLIPAYLLPVIDNALGSYVCVAVSGPKRGAVFFWEHELVAYDSEEPTDQGVFFVAPSFDAFLDVIEVNVDAV